MPFTKPNFTVVPNEFFDEMMQGLTGGEVKIFLCICRKTKGWNKKRDYISTSQIMKMTGLSNRSTITAVKSLVEKRVICEQKCKTRTKVYSLAYEESSQAYEESSQVKPKTYEESSYTKESIKETIKEKKEEKELFLEYVYLSKEEKKKLNKIYGITNTEDYIDQLNNWLAQMTERKRQSKGVSHYHRLDNWMKRANIQPIAN